MQDHNLLIDQVEFHSPVKHGKQNSLVDFSFLNGSQSTNTRKYHADRTVLDFMNPWKESFDSPRVQIGSKA